MAVFKHKSCVALTWAPDGRCWGVHLRRVHDGCAVALFWSSSTEEHDSLVAGLAEGLRCLGPRENTIVVVGGAGPQCGLADLDMPDLRLDDLSRALRFELAGVAPVRPEELVWGYRVLDGAAQGRQAVRLFYLRQSTWDRWVSDVGALGQGVDSVIPAPAALDPVLRGVDVFLPADEAGDGFLFAAAEDGGREVVPGTCSGEDIFGALPAPLRLPGLDLGGLGAMKPEDQQGFAGALIVGMYGLSGGPHADRRTALALPYEVQPRRHRLSQLVAIALLSYVILLAALGGWRLYRADRDRRQELQNQRAALQAEITELEARLDDRPRELIAALREEVPEARESYVERPSLARALLELTTTIGPEAWCEKFEWTDGSIVVHLRESEEDVNLAADLEISPFLGDVMQITRQVRGDVVSRRFQLSARFDTSDDLDRAEPGREPPPGTEPETQEDVPPGAGAGVAPGTEAAEPRRIELPPPPPPVP